ncbi:MAG: O-antigen ligase family protein [bacterium]
MVSTTLVFTAWIFLFTSIYAVRLLNDGLYRAFKAVIILNALLFLAALLILPFPQARDLMWYSIPISPEIPGFPRLKLLAYESSHYALLMTPVFLYFILRVMTGKSNHPLLVVLAVGVPLAFSLSFGVLAALIIALIIGSIIYIRNLSATYYRYFLYGAMFTLVAALLVYFLWPENPVYTRIHNIFSGADTSAKGRLRDSFMFAFDLVRNNRLIMGIGPGQIKILAHDLIINSYQYSGEYAEVVRIPNSMAEMLATYGFYGALLKTFFLLFFFFRLKIYNNLYRFILFIFMFIYQFTGSFTVNIAELGTWAIIFSARAKEFDINRLKELKA